MKTKIYNAHQLTEEQIAQLAADLSAGAVAVFATDTVYGIGTGALCEPSIARIYELKKRPASQPLQLLTSDFLHVQQWVKFSPGALHVAQVFWPGALTLIVPPSEKGKVFLRGGKALGRFARSRRDAVPGQGTPRVCRGRRGAGTASRPLHSGF